MLDFEVRIDLSFGVKAALTVCQVCNPFRIKNLEVPISAPIIILGRADDGFWSFQERAKAGLSCSQV